MFPMHMSGLLKFLFATRVLTIGLDQDRPVLRGGVGRKPPLA